jgi:hypothetical protein
MQKITYFAVMNFKINLMKDFEKIFLFTYTYIYKLIIEENNLVLLLYVLKLNLQLKKNTLQFTTHGHKELQKI